MVGQPPVAAGAHSSLRMPYTVAKEPSSTEPPMKGWKKYAPISLMIVGIVFLILMFLSYSIFSWPTSRTIFSISWVFSFCFAWSAVIAIHLSHMRSLLKPIAWVLSVIVTFMGILVILDSLVIVTP